MAIRVECQFCGRVALVNNAQADQFIKCPDCRAEMRVPSLEDRPPDAEFALLPTRRAWIGAIFLLAVAGMVIFVIASLANRVAKLAQPNGPPAQRPLANPPQQRFPNRPAPARPIPAVVRNRAPQNRNRAPHNEVVGPPVPLVPWTVAADPPTELPTIPAKLSVRIAIPEGPNPEIIFPSAPSTMVSLGHAGHGNELREIWDFRANRRLGTTRGLKTMFENLEGYFRPLSSLSSDGRFFVTQGLQPFDFVVWDVVAERPTGIVRAEHAPTAGLIFGALARPDRLLTCGFGSPFQVSATNGPWRKWLHPFPRDNQFDRNSLAISPRGRYLSVFDKSRQVLRFYDTEAASPVGQVPLPPFEPAGPMNCECVSFSPDGREVAALFNYNSHSHLVAWELSTGRLVKRIDFGGNLRTLVGARFAYLFTPLEWFPNQTRWLVYGQGIVDRHAGKVIWKIPDEPSRYQYGIRHVASDECVLSVTKEGDQLFLGSIALPLADIDRAAQIPDRS
ncbi:MAG TPA: hypothetical protein VFG04_10730 [Planctomycetaceae bacterium]|jgi:hypothetical protein|nr:hypothetical protein [Planctomycetaceae bacterium]